MLKSSMEAASYKRHIYTTLSAVLLLATASSASAATGLSDTDYCQDGAQDQTPSYTYQSDLQQTMNCMLTQLEPYQQNRQDTTPKILSLQSSSVVDLRYSSRQILIVIPLMVPMRHMQQSFYYSH